MLRSHCDRMSTSSDSRTVLPTLLSVKAVYDRKMHVMSFSGIKWFSSILAILLA